MKRVYPALAIFALVIGASTGIETYMEHRHQRDFAHAMTVAQGMRYGKSRRSRLDVWFEFQHGHQTVLRWTRRPRSWFDSAVPMALDVTFGDRVLRYVFSADLVTRQLSAIDNETRRLEAELRHWAKTLQ